MTSSPTSSQPVAVIGATGTQGSSVVNAMLSTGHPVYALTRSAVQYPIERNLSVIETDITDPGSLRRGLVGAWALFVNTLSDYSKPEGTEEQLLKSIVDAAAESHVQYLVLSVLPEGMPARAYVEKARAMHYAREVAKRSSLKPIFVQVIQTIYLHLKPIANIVLQMGWYMSGFSSYMSPVPASDGVMEFRWSTIDENTICEVILKT